MKIPAYTVNNILELLVWFKSVKINPVKCKKIFESSNKSEIGY
jgi:hypothetical protein